MNNRSSVRGAGRALRHFVFAMAALCAGVVTAQPAAAGRLVAYSPNVEAGTIVIAARQRALYLVVGEGRAIRYPVAVPKPGKEWSGMNYVDGKHVSPDWIPPPVVKRDHPELPNFIAGGSPRNPMGVAALTLAYHGVAIHGTTHKMRSSIGTAASYGCIRMLNEDVADLYERVDVGSPVIMQW